MASLMEDCTKAASLGESPSQQTIIRMCNHRILLRFTNTLRHKLGYKNHERSEETNVQVARKMVLVFRTPTPAAWFAFSVCLTELLP